MRRGLVRRLRTTGVLVGLGITAFGCTEGTGPGALGQLRLRAVFVPGEEPAALGLAVSDIHVVVRRGGATGAVAVDTTLPFEAGATLSWILDLSAPPEAVDISAELGQGGARLYSGTRQGSVAEGIDASSGTVHDVTVRFVGSPESTIATIEITPDSAGLHAIGAAQPFHAVARNTLGATVPDVVFSWSSGDTTVAVVDSIAPDSARATARAAGRAMIYATAGGVIDSAVLTVSDDGGTVPTGPIASIEVTPPAGLITALGGTEQFTAIARDAQSRVIPGVTFSWASSQAGVASVDATGRATGHAQGVTSITASAGGITAGARLVVTQIVASVVIVPASVTLGRGDSIAFTAVARDANGHIIPSATFAWSSSDPAVASVHAVSGVATANAEGLASIRAVSGGASGTASLRVVEVGGITLSPSGEPSVLVNATVQFTAVVRDLAGNVITGIQLTWSSTDPGVASIHAASGLATGLLVGRTRIVVAAGSVSARVSLDVVAPGTGAAVQKE